MQENIITDQIRSLISRTICTMFGLQELKGADDPLVLSEQPRVNWSRDLERRGLERVASDKRLRGRKRSDGWGTR